MAEFVHPTTLLSQARLPTRFGDFDVAVFEIDGTPADCVKIGVGSIFEGRPPDIAVSGINLGANTATNVIYSGTVSAATEARILGVPSMAISLATFRDPDWAYAASVGRRIARAILERGLPPKVLLNVNVPNLPRANIRGIRVTRQGDSTYIGEFSVREDPRRQPYYWLSGSYVMQDQDPATDAWAIDNGFVSVTPVTYDLTAHEQLDPLRAWGWRT